MISLDKDNGQIINIRQAYVADTVYVEILNEDEKIEDFFSISNDEFVKLLNDYIEANKNK